MMEELKQTALVGTEKKPLDGSSLPETIRQYLPDGDPETQFLQANAYLNYYRLAGQYPRLYSGTVDEFVIEEERPIASESLLLLYPKFALIDYHLRDAILRSWLNVLIKTGTIVNPQIVVNLLSDGQNAPAATKTMITRVVGNKGAWIIQNDPGLSIVIQMEGKEAWGEGTTAERKAAFSGLYATDPAAAIEQLKSTWSGESIVTKKVFLEWLADHPSNAGVAFGESMLQEFAHHPKEKKTERECRRLAAAMLLRTPGSSLYVSTTERLDKYFSKDKKGLLGFVTGKETVSMKLPESGDDSWNAGTMDVTFGVEGNGDIALFHTPSLYWLSHLLTNIPMTYWAGHFDADYSRCVEYWLTHSSFTTIVSGSVVSIFYGALVANAQIHNDHLLANVLINRWKASDKAALLSILEPKDFERYVANNDLWDDFETMAGGPFDGERSWSLKFSERVLEHVYELALKNKPTGLGRVIALYAHPDALDTLYRINEKARNSSMYNVWSTGIFQIAHIPLEVRNKIRAISSI